MPTPEVLRPSCVSIRKLPVNFDPADGALFFPGLKANIPATVLLELKGIAITPSSILSRGSRVLAESFPAASFLEGRAGLRYRAKFLVLNWKRHRKIDQPAVWFTDIWSRGYFHWMTDALPRLFTLRDRIADKTLLLPGQFRAVSTIEASLQPFVFRAIEFIDETVSCAHLTIPTRTAPTGNYNDAVIQELRAFYTGFYGGQNPGEVGDRIYVSRSKSWARRVVNETECLPVLAEFGFQTVYFEDLSFEQQVEIASKTRYLVSNHGAGLTNMLFMRAGGHVMELRKRGDAANNCYFALASAVELNYFYQLCDVENLAADSHAADLVVNPRLLRQNLEKMLAQ